MRLAGLVILAFVDVEGDVDDRADDGERGLHGLGLVVGIELQELVRERDGHAIRACVDNLGDLGVVFAVKQLIADRDVFVAESNVTCDLVVYAACDIDVFFAVVVFAHLVGFERNARLFDGYLDLGFAARPHDEVAVGVAFVHFDETFDLDDAFMHACVDSLGFHFHAVHNLDVGDFVLVRLALQHVINSVDALAVLADSVNVVVFGGSNADTLQCGERDFKS